LNQERKDFRIGRILLKEKRGVSELGKEGCKDDQDPAHLYILPFLVQDKFPFLKKGSKQNQSIETSNV